MHVMILTALVASAVGASAFAPSVPHALSRNAMPLALRSRSGLQGLNMKEPNLGLAEPYIGSVPEAKKVFAFLQSKDNSLLSVDQTKQLKDVEKQIGDAIEKVAYKDGKYLFGDFVSTWVYTRVIKNGGFNDYSEKVVGRIAMMAVPQVFLQTFDGNVLSLLARDWFSATILTWAIIVASTVTMEDDISKISGDPVGKALESVPADVKKSADEVVEKVQAIFTPDAELTNSRAAIGAMGVWIFTALLFGGEPNF